MTVSPFRSKLYLIAGALVTSISLLLAIGSPAQSSRGKKVDRGPRALGLVELAPSGKARMIPITILVDGQYYDAGAYKASPVPMALWAETVYEGVKTGVSQGIFTVSTALENQKTNEWLAEGKWQSAESLAAKSSKAHATSSIPRGINDEEGPPVLRHSGSAKPKPPEAPPSTPPASPAPPTPTPQTPPPAATPAQPPNPAPPDQSSQADAGPTLKRGKPGAESPDIDFPAPTTAGKAAAPSPTPGAPATGAKPASQIQLIPAISDANGPEPHSYAYDLKPDEQDQWRKKLLAMASDQINAYVKPPSAPASTAKSSASAPSLPRHHRVVLRPVPPEFDDVQFHAFDLFSSNEPIFVLTAKARLAQNASSGSAESEYMVVLVTRQDVNSDTHKVFSSVTDNQHLDVSPQYELIDAVDVDGDGNGELLFRQISDAGAAFDVYRVIGDQLYPLFQGTP